MALTRARTGGELLVESLASHGVTSVFGIPGTHNLGIFAAMKLHDIVNVTCRHEQGAGYAADGYARSSGKVGVVVTTTGPGATNAATALGQAYSDSIPVLLIASGMPSNHPSAGCGSLHEQIDQCGTFFGLVEHSHRVRSVSEIPTAVARAFARMSQGRPRPEYIEIPMDLLDVQDEVHDVIPVPRAMPKLPAAVDLKHAAKALSEARTPLIIAGGGAVDAGSELREIAEMLGAPVLTSTNGKGVLREDHPLALGSGMQLEVFSEIVESSDAVLAVGTELAPSDWFGRYPAFPDVVVRIDIDSDGLLSNVAPSHPLLGDATASLSSLSEELEPSKASVESVRGLKDKFVRAQEKSGEIWLESLYSLSEVLPENTVIAADNAMPAYKGAVSLLKLKRPRSFLFPTGFGTLGYGLPAGIGAKLADPEKPVVVIHGDGGLMFVASELAVAAEQQLSLPVIVYDNGGYGEIREEMELRGDVPHSVSFTPIDFVGMAESLGCFGVHLSDPSTLGEAVLTALRNDRPTLIHILESNSKADRR